MLFHKSLCISEQLAIEATFINFSLYKLQQNIQNRVNEKVTFYWTDLWEKNCSSFYWYTTHWLTFFQCSHLYCKCKSRKSPWRYFVVHGFSFLVFLELLGLDAPEYYKLFSKSRIRVWRNMRPWSSGAVEQHVDRRSQMEELFTAYLLPFLCPLFVSPLNPFCLQMPSFLGLLSTFHSSPSSILSDGGRGTGLNWWIFLSFCLLGEQMCRLYQTVNFNWSAFNRSIHGELRQSPT